MNVVNQMTQVALSNDPGTGSHTFPTSPIVVTSETLSSTNPNGVLHIDTTQARVGETSTIKVTATDPATGTSQVQSFTVTVAEQPITASIPLILKPIAYSATQTYTLNTPQDHSTWRRSCRQCGQQ